MIESLIWRNGADATKRRLNALYAVASDNLYTQKEDYVCNFFLLWIQL